MTAVLMIVLIYVSHITQIYMRPGHQRCGEKNEISTWGQFHKGLVPGCCHMLWTVKRQKLNVFKKNNCQAEIS